MVYYATVKCDKIMQFAVTWMGLEAMFNEVYHKDIHGTISLICDI